MAHDTTARTLRISSNAPYFSGQYVFGKWKKGSKGGGFVALRQGGTFHAEPCTADRDGAHREGEQYNMNLETSGVLYGPVHPSTEIEDVEGAVYAHDTGTAWLFAACSPEEHVQFAADVYLFATGLFAASIAKAQVKVDEATNPPVKAAAVAKVKALVAFSEAVGTEAHKQVVSAVLGHFHKHPHDDHRRNLTVAAVNAVLAAWDETGKTDKSVRQDRAHVTMAAAGVKVGLQADPDIEWRHERAARLKAEKEAVESAPSGDAESEG